MKMAVVATNNTDKTLTVMVDDQRYEYWLAGDFEGIERKVRTYLKNNADGRALNLLKRVASRYDRVS